MDYHLKFKLTNVPQNVLITQELPTDAYVTLHDVGSKLLSYRSGGGLPNITVDFSKFETNKGHVILKNSVLKELIQAHILPTSKISAIKPEKVEYYYNTGTYRQLPIVLCSNLKADKFYSISDVRLYPDSVKVYAPSEVLDTMTAVYTEFFQLQNITERTVRRVPFIHITGTKFMPENMLLRVDVDQITEKTITVPIHKINFPAEKALRTFPASAKVTFQVPMKIYRKITAEDFAIAINYDEVLNNTHEKLPLKLKSVPNGITHVRITPSEVDYILENVSSK